MKHLLLTTIAAVVLVGCGNPEADRALLDAAEKGNIEAVKQHLAAGADVNAKDQRRWTPLHHAAYEGHKQVAELLIAAGADVNAGDMTPLHWAANRGHEEVAELLIAKGADVNFKDSKGRTPLGLAAGETIDLLRKHGGKTDDWLNADESIHKAARAGNIEAVKQHLAAGTDVDAKDEGGNTPLYLATGEGHKEMMELLIARRYSIYC